MDASALDGILLYDESPVGRVLWESQTRKVHSDEKYRIDRSQRVVIDSGTADRMRMAVGFRNVLVHEYVGVDDAIVLARLADLNDLEAFIEQVSRWVSRSRETP